MKSHYMKKHLYFSLFFIPFILNISRCKKDAPIQGNLNLKIIETGSQGVKNAMVRLTPVDQTGFSDNLGNVLFQSLDISQLYTAEVSKEGYDSYTQTGIQLKADQTLNITVNLSANPSLNLSDTIFDFDSSKVQIPLFISNKGQGILNWQISVGSLLWISAIPNMGATTAGPDLVYINIDRTNLSQGVHNEHVFITSNGGLKSLEIKVTVSGSVPPQSTVTDIDGNIYSTILIDNRWWMNENLRVTHSPSGNDIQSYYYNNSSEYLTIYGRLYTWEVVMNYASQEKVQGICPNGWHIPSRNEWDSMILYLGGHNEAGGKLKATGTLYWLPPNEGATNRSGFTALPGGDRWYDGTYHYKGERAFFWTSTEYDNSQAFLSYLHNATSETVVQEVLKVNGMSVRCIKNQ